MPVAEPTTPARGLARAARMAGTALAAIAVAGLWVWAAGAGTARVDATDAAWSTTTTMAVCAAAALGINWLVFIPSAIVGTERFYDLCGTVTFVAVVALAVGGAAVAPSGGAPPPRSLMLAAMVVVWSVRLGVFLFARVRAAGHDRRFAALRHEPDRFFATWTMQGLWVLLTAGAALAAIANGDSRSASGAWWAAASVVGVAIWGVGFAIEVVADTQKQTFRRRREPGAPGFINSGLWAWSRHPNYFGEILVWIGVAVVAAPALVSLQHLTLVSPVFVWLLLTRVSGIPLLERSAAERWGDDPRWQAYMASTPRLIPRSPRNRR